MNKLLLFLLASSFSTTVMAQNFTYGEVDEYALGMKRYNNDTSAHAVVLNEYGTSKISFTNDYHIMITFEYHTKIKFFDNKEFENEGTFEIPIYNSDGLVYEDVEDIKGVTFYKDDKGDVQQAVLDPKKVFIVKN